MTRSGLALAFVFAQAALLAGCGSHSCDTTTQCGSGEVCADAQCQALSCNDTYYAIDPSDGSCRPLPACGNRDDVRTWASCADPCKGLGANACSTDSRCQPAFVTDAGNDCLNLTVDGRFATPAQGGLVQPTGCGGTRKFSGCRANALRVDPCANLDSSVCTSNPLCTRDQFAECPPCPSGVTCDCGGGASNCRLKTCSDYTTNSECLQDPTCSNTAVAEPVANTGGFGSSPDAGIGGLDDPFFGCFEKGFGSCFSMDEVTCGRHPECHPVGAPCYCPPGATCDCGGGSFYFCEPDDGLARCNHDSDCGGGQRCSNDEVCAPPIGSVSFGQTSGFSPTNGAPLGAATADAPGCAGLCVPQGCTGYGETRCVADPSCEPVYLLNCSPYGGGFFEGDAVAPGCDPSLNGDGNSCNPCEPNFTQCVERKPSAQIDPEVSILERDTTVLDSAPFSFGNVMAALAGDQDPSAFVDAWLTQLTTSDTVNGKTAQPRAGAAAYFAQLPRLPDGRLDLDHLGFQPTSLSNRIDLAGPHDCGEARITYALAGGVTDRRHRMTVIVELRQPDDGTRCAATARRWIALSHLHGEDLRFAFMSLYGPLLNPQSVNQVRTNEFLVGDALDPQTGAPTPWELREFRVGSDGALHLSLSKQALDPAAAQSTDFQSWLAANDAAVVAQKVVIPEQYLAVTSSENGSRINLFTSSFDQFQLEQSLNQMACAGCHTTETNSAFAHVGERWKGTGRAKISDFLRNQLPVRAQNLFKIGLGQMDQVVGSRPTLVH